MAGHALHPVDREIAVKFDSVSFSYGDVRVLENASFHIHRGEFVALVGPNGSGKTTVLKLLLGLEEPAAGSIELFGASRGQAAAYRIGFVPQQPPADHAFPITVRDLVRMGLLRPFKGYSGDKAAVAEAMEQAGIAGLAQRPYGALSGGQRRRALVARALASKPDILILDEPTANMDEESETRLFETLGALKPGTTILIVTHDTEFVSALTDRVLCLGDGGHGIVQHRIEAAVVRHGGFSQGARVLHGENIPADDCYDNE
jgi:zinc transport system ATP-binding protein